MELKGYRPFRDLKADLGPLEVFVGANGSGKSALFEFLRFLRDGMLKDIPLQIIPGTGWKQVFHVPGEPVISWDLTLRTIHSKGIRYHGELQGPVGRFTGPRGEMVIDPSSDPSDLLTVASSGSVGIYEGDFDRYIREGKSVYNTPLARGLALATARVGKNEVLRSLYDFISTWGFFDTYRIDGERAQSPATIHERPVLDEDFGNLNAVLHYLQTEHETIFKRLVDTVRLIVPSIESISVKARGGPGQAMTLVKEHGSKDELSLADMSNGTIRLICWATLCYLPDPPSLVCIDEPDQGVHPRTLPILAALFRQLSRRSQVFLSTHDSYFLSQFEFENIAVLRRRAGASEFVRPDDSAALKAILKDAGFAADEIEHLHRSEELELLP